MIAARTLGVAVAVAFVACNRDVQAGGERRAARYSAHEDSLARIRWSEAARYRQLMRAARYAADMRSAFEQTTCESQRLFDKLGESEALRAMSEAHFVLMQTRKDSIEDRILDRSLHMQAITMLKPEACDSIARTWPPLDTLEKGYPGPIVVPPR